MPPLFSLTRARECTSVRPQETFVLFFHCDSLAPFLFLLVSLIQIGGKCSFVTSTSDALASHQSEVKENHVKERMREKRISSFLFFLHLSLLASLSHSMTCFLFHPWGRK